MRDIEVRQRWQRRGERGERFAAEPIERKRELDELAQPVAHEQARRKRVEPLRVQQQNLDHLLGFHAARHDGERHRNRTVHIMGKTAETATGGPGICWVRGQRASGQPLRMYTRAGSYSALLVSPPVMHAHDMHPTSASVGGTGARVGTAPLKGGGSVMRSGVVSGWTVSPSARKLS